MDMYPLLSFASGVAITTLAFILLLVRIEPDEESPEDPFRKGDTCRKLFSACCP